MNSKSSLILLILLSLLLAALLSRNGALALMALPFLFFLAAGYLSAPTDVHLRAARNISHTRAERDVPISMTLTVENEGQAVPRLCVTELVQPNLRFNGALTQLRVTLPPGAEVALHYTFQPPRGRYEWQTVEVTVSDPLGLFEKKLALPAAAHTLSLPELIALRRVRFQPRHTLSTAGPNLSRRAGSGIDFLGVREFRPGDSLRSIHWRKTARHPQLFFSKEFEREEMADIGLLLDGSLAVNLTCGEQSLFEHSVLAAAALAKHFLRVGNRVSLLVLGEQMTRVFPGAGKGQLVRILDQLAACAPGEKISFDTLRYLPVKLFPSHSLIVVISPLRQGDVNTLARLRAAGYQVLVVSPNPVAFAAQTTAHDAAYALAVRAACLERQTLLRRIHQMDVSVVDWRVDQPLEKTLRALRRV